MALIQRAADWLTDAVGHPITFLGATVGCVIWAVLDRPFDWLDAASDLTLWLLFGLQASQNRMAREWTAELRELVRAVPEADETVAEEAE